MGNSNKIRVKERDAQTENITGQRIKRKTKQMTLDE